MKRKSALNQHLLPESDTHRGTTHSDNFLSSYTEKNSFLSVNLISVTFLLCGQRPDPAAQMTWIKQHWGDPLWWLCSSPRLCGELLSAFTLAIISLVFHDQHSASVKKLWLLESFSGTSWRKKSSYMISLKPAHFVMEEQRLQSEFVAIRGSTFPLWFVSAVLFFPSLHKICDWRCDRWLSPFIYPDTPIEHSNNLSNHHHIQPCS